MYRFRRIIECNDQNPPLAVTIEVSYHAERETIPYGEDESTGGVLDYKWVIVCVRGPIGEYYQPGAFDQASEALAVIDGLDSQIREWAAEDFAQRAPR